MDGLLVLAKVTVNDGPDVMGATFFMFQLFLQMP